MNSDRQIRPPAVARWPIGATSITHLICQSSSHPMFSLSRPYCSRCPKEPCPACDDTYWVCENHPDKPWRKPSPGVEGCECGAGMPCELCNAGSGPALMPDFTVTIDDKGPRH